LSKEALPDLAGAQWGFSRLAATMAASICSGIAVGAPGPIREPIQSAFLITLEDLVAGFAGDLKFAAQRGHALAVFESNHESYAFVHNRTFLPWHPTSRPLPGEKV
jgi:hypothetical protein